MQTKLAPLSRGQQSFLVLFVRCWTGPYLQGFLNAVAVHERGFFVGGMGGRLFLFESTSMKGTGGRRQDAYVLSRVVRLFDTDLVELGNGKGSDYRWVSFRRGYVSDHAL